MYILSKLIERSFHLYFGESPPHSQVHLEKWRDKTGKENTEEETKTSQLYHIWQYFKYKAEFLGFFGPATLASEILVLPPGIKPWGPGSESSNPNHWIAKEFLKAGFLILGTTDLLNWLFLVVEGCPVHWRMLAIFLTILNNEKKCL